MHPQNSFGSQKMVFFASHDKAGGASMSHTFGRDQGLFIIRRFDINPTGVDNVLVDGMQRPIRPRFWPVAGRASALRLSPMNDQGQVRAHDLLRQFKGDAYVFGLDCFSELGRQAASLGQRASVVISGFGKPWGFPLHRAVMDTVDAAGVTMAGELIPGAAPNAPREDVLRLAESLDLQSPGVVIAVGGGSGIDAVKAAVAYWCLHDQYSDLNTYFGLGKVTEMLKATERELPPLMAVQLASGSAAHLTKYANVTDVAAGQKMLIIDEAVVPTKCLFDYAKTTTMSRDFTMDGALDGVAHCLEVYFGYPAEKLAEVEEICLAGIHLCINNVETACAEPENPSAREALGLGTDLGGYAIMTGGTNGAHLTSFSLVDLLPHGRACALMNPYYTVFFAPAIERQLRHVGKLYQAAGYTQAPLDQLQGRDLGLAVADAMVTLSQRIGFPTTLEEVPGFTPAHIERALTAAKNPALDSKLKNMPVPLAADTVDVYMAPILEAARTGDFGGIRTMP
jgi:alcohol dehydrogenase